MLKIDVDGNMHARPIVLCDWCKKRITTVGEGIYTWATSNDTGEVISGDILLIHKSGCFDKMEAANPDIFWKWSELEYFILRLGNNLGINWPLAIEGLSEISKL